jgi:oligopeptide/dipeptide ABC transporter ATP-binding protein
MHEAPLLEVSDLTVTFQSRSGPVRAVSSASFSVERGQILGLVGESGCGKSTVARALVRLLPGGASVSGQVRFDGRDLLDLPRQALIGVRGAGIAMVFQDPMTALNPLLTIGQQIVETLRAHGPISRAAARRRAVELLAMVGIPNPAGRLSAYPHQMSGGMRQRAMIAIAISVGPRLLIADEPTTALDVTIQAQVLELLLQLKRQLGMAVILVSHDLGVVAGTADRVQVMYAGYMVEAGTVDDVLLEPQHPYTRGLIDSLVPLDGPRSVRLRAIPGTPPTLRAAADRCPFAPRCDHRFEPCDRRNPGLVPVRAAHRVACWAVSGVEAAARGGDEHG